MALENIVATGLHRRWLISFGFGLVHGFGFSFALKETLQFAGAHLVTSLLAFNVGVELGQLLVLLLLVPLLDALLRGARERAFTVVLSALVAHTGWHWMLERSTALRQFRFERPAFDVLLAASGLRWLMLLLVGGALAYTAFRFLREPGRAAAEGLTSGRPCAWPASPAPRALPSLLRPRRRRRPGAAARTRRAPAGACATPRRARPSTGSR
jgi:hypothetical protein